MWKNLLLAFVLTLPITMSAQDSTKNVSLGEVEVIHMREGNMHSRSSLMQVETITRQGLTQMACCTLASSFENTATTQTSYNDAITGTRQIQMLGLSGIYTQTTAENVPFLRGAAYPYGWDYTPSAWLDGISISKGSGSVVNGYDGISGQMNFDFQKPHQGQPLYVDFYTDSELHNEMNAVLKHGFSPNLYGELMLHTTQTTMPHSSTKLTDRNKDGFMDMPDVENYNIYNRWLYFNKANTVQSRQDFRFTFDRREGGHVHDGPYQMKVRNLNFQTSNKTGISIGEREGQSIGIINSFTAHGLRTRFGGKNLNTTQFTYNGNIIFNSYIGMPEHAYQVGLSYTYDKTENFFAHFNYDYANSTNDEFLLSLVSYYGYQEWHESVVGGFAEYTNTSIDNLTVQLGARIDHNSLYGLLFTPRFNVKYAVGDWLVARVSAGRGYRSANYFIDNINLMASGRQVWMMFTRDDQLEKAWTMGGNLIFTIPIWNNRHATLSLDYYRIDFSDKLVTDLDFDSKIYVIYKQAEKSHTDTWQADLNLPIVEGLQLYAAYKYTRQRVGMWSDMWWDSEQFIAGGAHRREQPLVNNSKALLNLQYATAMRRWVFDATLQWNGKVRLPDTYDTLAGVENNFKQTSKGLFSKPYMLAFAQVTRRFKTWEVYLGADNIFDYRQKHPVLNGEGYRSISLDFDGSTVWAPVTGHKFYIGMRLHLGKFM